MIKVEWSAVNEVGNCRKRNSLMAMTVECYPGELDNILALSQSSYMIISKSLISNFPEVAANCQMFLVY